MTALLQFIDNLPWRISFQVFTAIVAGYLFATVASVLLVKAFPPFRADLVAWGMLLSFANYMMAVMWVFSQRSLLKGCGYLWLMTLLLALLSWGLWFFEGAL